MTFEKSLSWTPFFFVMILVLLQGTAVAEGLNGSVELFSNTGDIITKDSTGLSSRTRTDDFLQRYRLYFDNAVYPYVNLQGSGIFEKEASSAQNSDVTTKQNTTKIIPTVSLVLNNPFVTGSVSYEKREGKTWDPLVTNYRESKTSSLGFKPEGLPTLDMILSKLHVYDEEHATTDNENSSFSLSSRYMPVKNLDLLYRADYSDNKDLLKLTDSKMLNQTGRAAYSGFFFNGRAMLTTSHMLNRIAFKSSNSSNGEQVPLFPVAGLSGINDTPTVGVLDKNSALIDNNVAASSGINIGRLVSLGGDTKRRNMGLDFGLESEVNYLYVWVDRELPATAASSFSWEIYISSDNLNWSLSQTVFPATFNQLENRFEIAFNNVKTRYIKVVTRPLSVAVSVPLGVDLDNIFITELQPFIAKPTTQAVDTSAVTSQFSDVSLRVNIMRTDKQSLMYDMYFGDTRSSDQPSSRSVLTNALTASQRFNSALSGNLRVARENDGNTDGSRDSATSYAASIVAALSPLPTVSNNLTLNANREERDGSVSNSRSLFLNNTADWYPGINTSLNGGISYSTSAAGANTENILINFGIGVVPHRAVMISANYEDTETRQSGGGGQNRNTFSENTSVSVSYNPFSSLYVIGSIAQTAGTDQERQTLQNYSISWAVQRSSGSLQFNLTYTESLDPTANTRNRIVGPNVRWRINPHTSLGVSYLVTTVDAPTSNSESRIFFTSLRLNI